MKHKTVCIVGLGYVGLPLAEDDRLRRQNNECNIEFTSDPVGDVGGVLKEIMMEESLNIEKTNKGEVYVVWEPESNSLER